MEKLFSLCLLFVSITWIPHKDNYSEGLGGIFLSKPSRPAFFWPTPTFAHWWRLTLQDNDTQCTSTASSSRGGASSSAQDAYHYLLQELQKANGLNSILAPCARAPVKYAIDWTIFSTLSEWIWHHFNYYWQKSSPYNYQKYWNQVGVSKWPYVKW